ncbi:MAG: NAD(P)/FAD-dependent oxidoreductase [Candidatus Hydrothermarchaeota archaeon]
MNEIYDAIIIGAGPAGLSCGLYLARSNLNVLLLEAEVPGGLAGTAPIVENYPGFPDGITGAELTKKMFDQARKNGAKIKFKESVIDLEVEGEIKKVITEKKEYETKCVVIATGARPIKLPEKLGIKKEDKLVGKGVHYCATCDGQMYAGKDVAVVGKDEYAVKEALFLNDICRSVTLIADGEISAEDKILEKLNSSQISVVHGTITDLLGEDKLEGVVINGRERLNVEALFVALGTVPNTELFARKGIEIGKKRYIKVDNEMRTNIEGVFACGDVTGGVRQIAVAVGEGVIAAYSVRDYLKVRK